MKWQPRWFGLASSGETQLNGIKKKYKQIILRRMGLKAIMKGQLYLDLLLQNETLICQQPLHISFKTPVGFSYESTTSLLF